LPLFIAATWHAHVNISERQNAVLIGEMKKAGRL
jgi:hypothetical protein